MSSVQGQMATGTASASPAQAVLHFSDKSKSEELLNLIKTSTTPLFIDFFAIWCGPCQLAAPVVEKLGAEFAGKVITIKVDVDALGEVAGQYGVMSIPTTITFLGGKEVEREIGFVGEPRFRAMMQKVVNQAAV